MKKSICLITILLFTSYLSVAQNVENVICKNSILTQFVNPAVAFNEPEKEILISFLNGFDDSVMIYLNDSLVAKTFLKTNEAYSDTDFNITAKIVQHQETYLTIIGPDYCLNVPLFKYYNILKVSFGIYDNYTPKNDDNRKWHLNYYNY